LADVEDQRTGRSEGFRNLQLRYRGVSAKSEVEPVLGPITTDLAFGERASCDILCTRANSRSGGLKLAFTVLLYSAIPPIVGLFQSSVGRNVQLGYSLLQPQGLTHPRNKRMKVKKQLFFWLCIKSILVLLNPSLRTRTAAD
jgi:hypothetical protein